MSSSSHIKQQKFLLMDSLQFLCLINFFNLKTLNNVLMNVQQCASRQSTSNILSSQFALFTTFEVIFCYFPLFFPNNCQCHWWCPHHWTSFGSWYISSLYQPSHILSLQIITISLSQIYRYLQARCLASVFFSGWDHFPSTSCFLLKLRLYSVACCAQNSFWKYWQYLIIIHWNTLLLPLLFSCFWHVWAIHAVLSPRIRNKIGV